MAEVRTQYEEAMRYIDNAKEALKKAGGNEKLYSDIKYVKSAAGIAYAGVEQAAKWLIRLKGIEFSKNA